MQHDQPVLTVRRASERGHAEHGWLDTRHTFSFADYFDPEHMGFRTLRVINEDRVEPGRGFPTHGHRDMEILTFVLEGAIAHKDSLGTESVLRPDEVQRMSAGTGVQHSEFNPSREEPLHLYQIWIQPDRAGHAPEYEQAAFPAEERRNRLRMLVSPDGRDGSLRIHQDARVFAALLAAKRSVSFELAPGRGAWLQVARGTVLAGGERLSAGDGASLSEPGAITIEAIEPAEMLLFDLA